MKTRTKFAPGFLLTFCMAGSLGLLGCGDDGLAKRYAVGGKVTYNGQPLEKGEITFMSVKPEGRGGTGVITNGYYKLTTQAPDDGAFPGDYNVIVTALSVDMSQVDAETKKNADKAKVETAMPDQAAMAHALKSAKSSIPAKYGQVNASGLKATVEQKSNTFDFALTD